MCPDLLFSEGSLRTPEQVVACAEEWLTFDCDSVLVDKLPSCAIPGTLELGGFCIHPSQCASGACSGSTNICGQCIPVVASGAACEPDVNVCPDGEECVSGTCAPVVPEVSQPSTGAAGTPCTVLTPCQAGLVCASDDARSGMICRPNLTDGDNCYFWSTEGDYYVCGSDGAEYCGPDLLCHTSPGQGLPCAISENSASACGVGLYCSYDTGTCEEVPGQGEACGTLRAGDDSVAGYVCAGSLCDTGICKGAREEGESCAEANTKCAEGTQCADGVCRATDQLTIYADLCAL
jgi:hypothetical protein